MCVNLKAEILALTGFWQFNLGNQAVEWRFFDDQNTYFI